MSFQLHLGPRLSSTVLQVPHQNWIRKWAYSCLQFWWFWEQFQESSFCSEEASCWRYNSLQIFWQFFVGWLHLETSYRSKNYYSETKTSKNIGLEYSYLVEKSFGLESLDVNHVEIVYPNVVYDAFGNVITNPVHTIVPEAFPGKAEWMTCSNFIPSGMRGFLECFLPPNTARTLTKRRQQTLALIGILRKFEKY